MRVNQWLVVNNRGSCKIYKKKPSVDNNEVALNLQIQIPDEVFKRPQIVAEITIPNEAVTSTEITADVAENLQNVLHQTLGLNFSIKVIDNENTGKSGV